MSANTSIEWTDATWPVVAGCKRVSPGCAACYAIRDARRLSGNPNPKVSSVYAGTVERQGNGQLDWTGLVRPLPDRLDWPLKWRKPRRIFVCNESDLFHEDVPDAFIDQVFAVMALARQHTFQVLTKRPERMRTYLTARNGSSCGIWFAAEKLSPAPPPRHWYHAGRSFRWPLPNVWLGVSCEHQKAADERIPLLLQTPAAIRFVSAEPLLGPLDLSAYLVQSCCGNTTPGDELNGEPPQCCGDPFDPVDWVIFGGESGPGARPCAMEWIERGVAQCRAAGIAPFVKQLGAYVVSEDRAAANEAEMRDVLGPDARWPEHRWFWRAGLGADRKGANLAAVAPELNIREFPASVSA